MAKLGIKHLLLFVIIVFLLYHLVDTCSCCYIDSFSVSDMKSQKHKFSNKNELKNAVKLWLTNKKKAKKKYGDISGWDVSSVTNMSGMFYGATKFNGDISGWVVSSVTKMDSMFHGAKAFNQDIGDWNVSSVTKMDGMFSGAEAFNQDIGGWNVNSVTKMNDMFYGAKAFNQDIGVWNVSSVTKMDGMFFKAKAFNQDIGGWDVSSVTDMRVMFREAEAFNQNLNCWKVDTTKVNTYFMFYNSQLVKNDNDPISTGCWDKKNTNYNECHKDCDSPAPPPPSPPSPSPPPPPPPPLDNCTTKCNERNIKFNINERCYTDPDCSNGGLGCKALGITNCRFCGFTPYAKCPDNNL